MAIHQSAEAREKLPLIKENFMIKYYIRLSFST